MTNTLALLRHHDPLQVCEGLAFLNHLSAIVFLNDIQDRGNRNDIAVMLGEHWADDPSLPSGQEVSAELDAYVRFYQERLAKRLVWQEWAEAHATSVKQHPGYSIVVASGSVRNPLKMILMIIEQLLSSPEEQDQRVRGLAKQIIDTLPPHTQIRVTVLCLLRGKKDADVLLNDLWPVI